MIPALILARGGSKGIPGKNLCEVLGTSLVGRCVHEAVQSAFDPVWVSSDSELILDEGARFGARRHRRPADYATDRCSTERSVAEFIATEGRDGAFSAIAVLQCTTPFLRARHMTAALRLFHRRDLDSVVTAVRFGRYLGYPSHDGRTDFIPMRPYRALRQAPAPPMWMENGGIYLAKSHLWKEGRRIGAACGVVEMGWWESLEIDEPEDLEVARCLAPRFLDPIRAETIHEGEGSGKVRWVYHD